MKSQTAALVRVLGGQAARGILVGVAWTAAVLLALSTGVLTFRVEGDVQWFAVNDVELGFGRAIPVILTTSLIIISFVVAIVVVGSYARATIAMGATRRNLAAAYLVVAAGMWLLALVCAALAWAVARGALAGQFTAAQVRSVAVVGAGIVLAAVVVGMLLPAVFLAWPWYVGVGGIALVTTVLPLVASQLPALEAALEAVEHFPGTPWLVAAAAAAGLWGVLGRLQLK